MRSGVCAEIAIAALVVLAAGSSSAHATFPDAHDGRLAFASDRDGNAEIYTMQPDGTGQTRLTDNPWDESEPAWSPTGRRIVYASDRVGNVDVYLSTNGKEQRLTDHPAADYSPAWAPDNRRIAFTSRRDGNEEIYVVAQTSGRISGRPERLTFAPGADSGPTWSSDKPNCGANRNRIAFESNRDSNFEIYVMNADGSGQTNLTRDPAADFDPTWSPDCRSIAFTRRMGDNYDIWVMKADGSGQTRLTRSPAEDSAPAWSPRGSAIAFTTNRTGNHEIYRMLPNGSDQKNLTSSRGDDLSPDWQIGTFATATGEVVRPPWRRRRGRGCGAVHDRRDGEGGRAEGDEEERRHLRPPRQRHDQSRTRINSVYGEGGNDKLFGGPGADTIYDRDGARDEIDGGDGRDRGHFDRGVDGVTNVESRF